MYEIINLDELIRRLEKYSHKELHVHHTWRPNHAQYYGTNHTDEDKRAIDRQKAMRDYHVKTNGWADIGQHVTLLPDGRFVTGRPFNKTPASIAGYNTGAFAVEMIGDFDKGKDKFEGKQKESMIGLAKWFDGRGKYIRFHRENSSKTCPGSGISKEQFMADVRNQKEGEILLNRTLRHGMEGEDVKLVQEFLKNLGYYTGPIDSKFGPGQGFLNSVKAFQKAEKLEVDGVIGPATRARIIEIMLEGKVVEKIIEKESPALKKKVEELEAELKRYKDFFKELKSLL